MKSILCFLLLVYLGSRLFAQDSLNNLKELQLLMKQRKDQFESYAIAADHRSGIFGNKTKKDLEKSREILLGIVQIDNRIMEELNRAIEARGMAKADYSIDQMHDQQTIQQLTVAADTLEKQLTSIKVAHSSLQKKNTLQQVALYFVTAMMIVMLTLTFLRRKR